MEEIIQWATVIIILIIVAGYIVKRIRRKGNGGCSCCQLSDTCKTGKCDDTKPHNTEKNLKQQ